MNSEIELMNAGFACLVEKLGIVDAERFVAMIKRDSFDYTIGGLCPKPSAQRKRDKGLKDKKFNNLVSFHGSD